MTKYHFVDTDSGEPVTLDLEFKFLMDNQKNGLLQHEGRLLRRDVARELSENPVFIEKNAGLEKVGPVQHKSEVACAVHPKQVNEANEHYKTVHPGIEFKKDGSVRFGSRGARRAFLRAAGFVDRDGSYGDG